MSKDMPTYSIKTYSDFQKGKPTTMVDEKSKVKKKD